MIVSPVVANLVDGGAAEMLCIFDLARDLAEETGGTVFRTTDPETDLPRGIAEIVIEACSTFSDCNENDTPDLCDISDGASADDNDNDIPDECE